MAATTFRGITYTTSAGGVEVDYDMPMWAGVDPDDTDWLTGYPGALTSFAARQTDGTNKMQPRLVRVHWSAATDDATLTLSPATATAEEKPAPVTEILFAMVQYQDVATDSGLSQHAATSVLSAGGAATSVSAIVTDGADATDDFSVGDYLMNPVGGINGKIASITGSGSARTLNLEANNAVTIANDAVLHKRTPLILKNTSGNTESMTLLLLVA